MKRNYTGSLDRSAEYYTVDLFYQKGYNIVRILRNQNGNGEQSMTTEFDVTITSKDMYRFNMYHAYHGFQGIFATVIGILVLIVAGATFGKIETMYTVLYTIFGIIFLVYVPFSLYMRSKRQILASKVLQGVLHYKLDEEGIHVSQNDQTADLPWNQIYKVVSTKSNLLIYSSRVNAYVIPRNIIEKEYEKAAQLASEHLEKYRLKLK